jgi:hypothetical protein
VMPIITGAQGTTCTGIPGNAAYTASEVLQGGWTQTFPPPPGTQNFFVECGQLLNIYFGNKDNTAPTATRTATRTSTATATRTATSTRTPNILPND